MNLYSEQSPFYQDKMQLIKGQMSCIDSEMKKHVPDTSSLLRETAPTYFLADGPLTRVEVIRAGMSIEGLDRVAAATAVPVTNLVCKLGLNPRTLRRRTDRLTAAETEKVLRVVRVMDKAREVFGSKEDARRWLSSPALALGGGAPIDFLDTDVGTEEVLNVLQAIDWGVYL